MLLLQFKHKYNIQVNTNYFSLALSSPFRTLSTPLLPPFLYFFLYVSFWLTDWWMIDDHSWECHYYNDFCVCVCMCVLIWGLICIQLVSNWSGCNSERRSVVERLLSILLLDKVKKICYLDPCLACIRVNLSTWMLIYRQRKLS